MTKPEYYDVDAGIRLTYDTLTDRGHDYEAVRTALDMYEGDLWFDIYGPAVDRAAEALGLSPYPDSAES